MNWIQNLDLRGRITEISQRFPLVLVFAFITTVTLILTIDDDSGKLFRWPVAGFIGFLAVLGWTLYCESIEEMKKIFWLGFGIIILLLGVYYYYMPSEISQQSSCFWYFTLGLSIILHLLIAIIPYFRHYDKITFVNYNISIFNSWMQSALYAFLLYLALCLSILALDNLFEINIQGILYFKLFILITGLIQSTLFLSDIPDDFADRTIPLTKSVFRVIVFYLFIPVTFLYGLIIYAYFFRVILTSHEMVEWTYVMILCYFGVGILCWLFTGYFENPQGNVLITTFARWFFPFSFIPCIFFFISIYKNIISYGITEEFYLVAITAAFIGIILVIYLFSLSKDLRLVPLIGIIVCMAGFWSGPLSVCHVPIRNQQKRLIDDMENVGLIKNGVLTIDTSLIYTDSAGRITNNLYFLNSKNALSFIKDFDQGHIIKEERDSMNLNSILDLLRLNHSSVNSNKYIEYNHDMSKVYDIIGFEKIIPLYYNIDKPSAQYFLKIENTNIILYANGEKAGESDISPEIIQLAERALDNNIIEREINGYLIRIIVHSASGTRVGSKLENLNITGYALLKQIDK